MTDSYAHDSYLRLMEAALAATSPTLDPVKTDTDLADAMGESRQTIYNWKRRGVSEAGAIKAQALFSVSANALLGRDEGGITEFTNVTFADTKYQPGLVYAWDEVIRMFRAGVEAVLPDVFSVELTDDALPGRARRGDVVTLCRSKADTVEAGDGVLVKTATDHYLLRIYSPKGDGTWFAEPTNRNFKSLHNVDDGLTLLAVVVGVPSIRWSTI